MSYEDLKVKISKTKRTWLITGVAGFIGSHLLEELLKLGQKVIGIDNFSTGHHHNLEEVKKLISEDMWSSFTFVEGDIRNYSDCQNVTMEVDYVLHQAALGSVPRSLLDPIRTNASNVTGFLNILEASRLAKVNSFTYAASSSTYGDHPALPKIENRIGDPLSPYAATKRINEIYAEVYAKAYDFESIGLRYFNVFGPRQDPNGAYAAVIPKWTQAIINGQKVFINGDGKTSRDFCYIENVVQANLLSATADQDIKNNIFNIALGNKTTLNELFGIIQSSLSENGIVSFNVPEHKEFREGDVRHSQASIDKSSKLLGYKPTHSVSRGIDITTEWYLKNNS